MAADRKLRALLVYFTFTQQTGHVAEVMEEALAQQGYDATKCEIVFTDPHWSKLFSEFPMRLPALRIPTIFIAQRRRRVGEVRIPEVAQEGDYDLVVIGSPTWWLTTNMPIRSYLKSPSARRILNGKPFAAFSVSRRYWKGNMRDVRALGEESGGSWLGETHFTAEGGQVKSMLSWLAFMKRGKRGERVLGMKMPKPNLKPDFEAQARSFIDLIVVEAVERRSRTSFAA